MAKENGASVVQEPWEEKDEHGTVKFAQVRTYGDTTHTFVDRKSYHGPYLPNYQMVSPDSDPLLAKL